MLIDAHSHWLPDEIISNAHFFHKGWGNIEAQLKNMDACGIAAAVLSYPTSDAHLKLGSGSAVAKIYNDNVSEILKRYPKRFIGAAVLPEDNSTDMREELTRAVEELGFKAVSLASSCNGVYLDDLKFLPVYKYAAENKIPVFVHPQIVNPIGFERVKDPLLTPVVEYVFDTTISAGKLLMSDTLRQNPQVKFVFAYFGGALCYLKQRFDATYQMLRSINFVKDLQGLPSDYFKNIYVDTSGDSTKANFLLALDLMGPQHILWGSDWPAKSEVSAGIQAIKDLDISQQDQDNILGGNLSRIFAL
ncbi:MAG: amidohydrolase family protein [Candidatus Omnitrophica bacterium]|jgi:predicted TIM-barrel fold metal-dependent hydrolase|nr:amidohydrolase family protein [Candidatus Omnitrophota bacterium]